MARLEAAVVEAAMHWGDRGYGGEGHYALVEAIEALRNARGAA
jgi:hypothetical protein